MKRLLTKSKFKLGLECPNKLFYTGKQNYANQKSEDPFLLALAEGGFQVEEYARIHFPGGVMIESDYSNYDYELYHEKTSKLLELENVIIYEAAFHFENLFIRTDILVKKGNRIYLNPGGKRILLLVQKEELMQNSGNIYGIWHFKLMLLGSVFQNLK